jgi:hopanoid biosynthesis associated radical SAM protein HpnH
MMRFPPHIVTDNVRHQVSNALHGNKRYPSVLMLEPLYTCNLACVGCALERHTGKLSDRVPLDRALKAVDDCGAPAVSICGGEPTIYPELPELVDRIIDRKRHIYLCTNALLMERRVFDVIPPNKRLSINIHLDGMRATHDFVTAREGVFDHAVEMIKASKARGYHTLTNTTIYKQTDVEEVEELCEMCADLGVDGMLIAPGYHYESVDRDVFMVRQEIEEKFRRVREFANRYPILSTPMFLEFAAGLRELDCAPWSTVTYTPRGWKGPCYLIGEGFYDDWDEFWNITDWDYWESRQDRRCQNCKMHSGFEASAVHGIGRSPRQMAKMALWQISA